MVNLNGEQQRIVNALADTHAEHLLAKATIRERIEAEYQTQLGAIRLRKAALVAEGIEAGVPKSRLGRAIGTTDSKTVKDLLDEGLKLRPEMPGELYSWSESVFVDADNGVTYEMRWLLTEDDHKAAGWRAGGVVDVPAHEGYLYVRTGNNPGWTAFGERAPDDALAWAEVNS